ncbi:MAG: prolyl oligopeptidase family serine peptidase [Alphaproteobacteria bacterium]|nr:prolyl oligopeptidase family serine peptidase [Alphaproteobacteria bacterium]
MSGKYGYIIRGFLAFTLLSANLLATSKSAQPFAIEIDYSLSSFTITKSPPLTFDELDQENQERRKNTLWTPLKRLMDNKSNTAKENQPSKKTASKIHALSTDDTSAPVIYRDRYSPTSGITYYDPIYYHVYVSDLIKTRKITPKGVVIHVYGGAIPMVKQDPNGTAEEVMYARENYIVYAINPKGVAKKGEWFRTLQGRTGGLFSTIDDINYFAYLLKYKVPDTRKNLPVMHSFIPESAPFFLCGSSMGGHVTLLVATDSKRKISVPHLGGDISVHKIFDGFMPSMAIVNVHDDLLSGTRVSQRRLKYFKGTEWRKRKLDTWLKNAYTAYNPYLYENHNERFSPQYRASNIDRPVLLYHGLKDINVSPEQSFNFHRSCQEANTAQWINLRYDPGVGHFSPSTFTEMYNFYETVYTFMDRVCYGKNIDQPFVLSSKDLQLTAAATDYASFLTRAHNIDLSTSYGSFLLNAVINHLKYKKETPNPHISWQSYKRGYSKDYYRMIATFYVHTLLPLSETKGPARLSLMDLRKEILRSIMQELNLEDQEKKSKILKKELRHLSQLQIELRDAEQKEVIHSIRANPKNIPHRPRFDRSLIKPFSPKIQKRIQTLKENNFLNFNKMPQLTRLVRKIGIGDSYKGLLCLTALDANLKADYLKLLNFMKTDTSLCSITFPTWSELI